MQTRRFFFLFLVFLLVPQALKADGAISCAKIFLQNFKIAKFQNLSEDSKTFWRDTGKTFKEILDKDFKREPNKKIYREQILGNHPQVQFYKELGFKITDDFTFESPEFSVLLENINLQVAKLNQKLQFMGSEVSFSPQIFLDLQGAQGLPIKVNLRLLQEYPLTSHKLVVKGNILKADRFYKDVSEGKFPLGGLESATGARRIMIDSGVSAYDANIVDFLHDLSHIGTFVRNPEYAQSYVRVFRHHYNKSLKMSHAENVRYFRELTDSVSKNASRIFYFSESAWLVKQDYEEYFKGWPEVSALRIQQHYRGSGSLNVLNTKMLITELKEIRTSWWKLFDPMGGVVNDMMSYNGFDTSMKSMLITSKVLGELDFLIKDLEQDGVLAESGKLSLLLKFMNHSPRLTVAKWEYFARSEDWTQSEVFKIYLDIFPQELISNRSKWKDLQRFLYEQRL